MVLHGDPLDVSDDGAITRERALPILLAFMRSDVAVLRGDRSADACSIGERIRAAALECTPVRGARLDAVEPRAKARPIGAGTARADTATRPIPLPRWPSFVAGLAVIALLWLVERRIVRTEQV
jgi:hypothetical protein